MVIALLAGFVALAVSLGVGLAVAVGGSTEVGQTTSAPVFGVGTPVAPLSTVPGTPSYATPHGVLTSWRFHSSGDSAAGAVRLKIFRYTGTGLVFKVLAESSLKTLQPDTAYDFKERIPVDQGDLLGLTAVADAEVGITVPGTPQNQLAQFGGGDIPPGQTGTATIAWPDLRPSVAATVESDADADGFGDETQDGCPQQTDTHAACSTSFTVAAAPGKKSVGLTVNVPGSGTVSAGDVKNTTLLMASASKKKKKKPLFRQVTTARAEFTPGNISLTVPLSGAGKRLLAQKGKLKAKIKVIYAPRAGLSGSQFVKVKLKSKK
ncbi:MAG: hypothetical protein QOD14_1584 [Solirubrobacterales bacterium]|nr:hypothetical protein [Solirubrobacterales bacterium]